MSTVSDYFGSLVFDDRVMKANLPADIYRSLRKTIDEGARLDEKVANAVAAAMKDWAVAHGATHFTHWFQPLTGVTADADASSIGRCRIHTEEWYNSQHSQPDTTPDDQPDEDWDEGDDDGDDDDEAVG